jgi:hypothetical protein
VIAAINGTPIGRIEEEDRMTQIRANQLTLTVGRGGKQIDVTMKK